MPATPPIHQERIPFLGQKVERESLEGTPQVQSTKGTTGDQTRRVRCMRKVSSRACPSIRIAHTHMTEPQHCQYTRTPSPSLTATPARLKAATRRRRATSARRVGLHRSVPCEEANATPSAAAMKSSYAIRASSSTDTPASRRRSLPAAAAALRAFRSARYATRQAPHRTFPYSGGADPQSTQFIPPQGTENPPPKEVDNPFTNDVRTPVLALGILRGG